MCVGRLLLSAVPRASTLNPPGMRPQPVRTPDDETSPLIKAWNAGVLIAECRRWPRLGASATRVDDAFEKAVRNPAEDRHGARNGCKQRDSSDRLLDPIDE